MDRFSGEATQPFAFLTSFLNWGQLLKERICFFGSKFFPSRVDPSSQDFIALVENQQITKIVSLLKNMVEKHGAPMLLTVAGPRSAIGRTPDSEVRGSEFDTRSSNILLFLLPLFHEGQLSVTGESMCMKYWLTA